MSVGASLVPKAVDVAWTYDAPGTTRPHFRLLRRLGDYPRHDLDGVFVLELDELFRVPVAPATLWGRFERVLFSASNGPTGSPSLMQAAVDFYFAAASDTEPTRVLVFWFDVATGTRHETE